ncbi:hypothetical protein D3C87_1469940 [compost metagenome]
MGPQLIAHQGHSRADEAAEMLPIAGNEVGSDCSTEIEYQAGTRGQVKPAEHRQPTIEPQPLEFLIPVTDTRHFASRRRTDHRHTESLREQRNQRLGFFRGPDTDQPAKLESDPLERLQALQQSEIRINDTLTHHPTDIRMEHPPLDETVSAVELKNHHATSG